MPRTVVLDEVHLTFRIPAALPAADVRAIRRALSGKAFPAALRRAVIESLKKYPTLTPVQVEISR